MTFEEALDQNGYIVYTNVGVSMMPLLRENRDVMMIHKRPTQRLKKLDAVLFVRPGIEGRGHYVLHRILKVLEDGYWIVGDNCTSGEIVREENVIGILQSVVRDGKEVDFHSLGYWLYLHLWCEPYWLRFFILRCKAFLRRGLLFVYRRLPKGIQRLAKGILNR